MRARNREEAITLAKQVGFGLSASIFMRDLKAIQGYAGRIEAGVEKINRETAAIEPRVPFGGLRELASRSREQGRAAMEFFTGIQSVYPGRAGLWGNRGRNRRVPGSCGAKIGLHIP